jgi:hypothetical protein
MSIHKRVFVLSAVALFLLAGLLGTVRGTAGMANAQASASSITDEEIAGLLFIREEEKLARDVYLTLNDKWSLKIFDNIIKSEEKHMEAMLVLLETYDLEDPVGINPVGVFVDPILQKLFDDLVARGMVSVREALAVGGYIEEIDLIDLESRSAVTERADILQVYANLARGSRNHLRAFVKQTTMIGVDYEVQALDLETFQSVIDAPVEKGGRWS